mgnify:FL=1
MHDDRYSMHPVENYHVRRGMQPPLQSSTLRPSLSHQHHQSYNDNDPDPGDDPPESTSSDQSHSNSEADPPFNDHLAAYNADNPFFPRFRPIPATEEELTNYLRNLRIRSLHCNSNAPEVAWFQSSTTTLLGPYGGQYAQISKTFTKLVTLDSAHFFAWYNTLCATFNSTGFHMDLLPKVIDMVYDADL